MNYHAITENQKTLALICFPPLVIILVLLLPLGGSYTNKPSKPDTTAYFFGFLNMYWPFNYSGICFAPDSLQKWLFASTVNPAKWWFFPVYVFGLQAFTNIILLLNADLMLIVDNATGITISVLTCALFMYWDRNHPKVFYGLSQRLLFIFFILLIYSLTFTLCQWLTQRFSDQNQLTQLILVAAYQTFFFLLRYGVKYLSGFVATNQFLESDSYRLVNSSSADLDTETEIRSIFIFPMHLFQYTFSRVLGSESSWLIFFISQIVHVLLEFSYFYHLKQSVFRYHEYYLRACATFLTFITYIIFIEGAYCLPWIGQGIYDLDRILGLPSAMDVHIGAFKTVIAAATELMVLAWADWTQETRSSSVFQDKFLFVLFIAIHTQTDLLFGLSVKQLERTTLH